MTRDELLEEVREILSDTVQPYGWSDKRLVRWMADGEDKFCELTGFFTDSTTYSLVTVEGVQHYPLDPRIIEVKEVWAEGRRLTRFTQDARRTAAQIAPPYAWQTDEQTGQLSLLQPPTGGVTLTLRAHRRAVKRLDHRTDGIFDVEAPSIPVDCHLALAEFAAYKAFGDHDSERQDPVKAADHYRNFLDYVADGKRLFNKLTGAAPRVAPSSQYIV